MEIRKIEADVWHAQVYMWGLRIWGTFASSREMIYISSRTNICQYVRILVFACIAGVAYLATMAYVGATFVYYPTSYFGKDYWSVVGKGVLIIIAIITFIVCIVGIVAGWKAVEEWLEKKSKTRVKIEEVMDGSANRPSIIAVAKTYFDAQSAGFCSAIEIVAPVAAGSDTRVNSVANFDVHVPVRSDVTTSTLVTVDRISTERIRFLPTWWGLIVISLLSAFALWVFDSMHNSQVDIEATWEGGCVINSWEKKSASLVAKLKCNGAEAQVSDVDTLLTYIQNQSNPRCFTDKSGEIYCNIEDRKRMKKAGS